MNKKVADEIMTGLREAIDYVRGRRVKGLRVWEIPPGAIKAARQRLALSQADFADRFGFSVRNLQKWEQGVARPSGAARAFLTVIARAEDGAAGRSGIHGEGRATVCRSG